MSEETTITQKIPIPFDPPKLLESRRVTGLVMIPEQKKAVSSDDGGNPLDLEWNTSRRNLMADPASAPPSLSRRSSLSGNILLVGKEAGGEEDMKAYWLQRKMAKTMHGSIRVGFVLKKHCSPEEAGASTNSDDECEKFPGAEWDAIHAPSSSPYPYEMVTIQMEAKASILPNLTTKGGGSDNGSITPINSEIPALQLLAAETQDENSHVLSSNNISVDAYTVYTITPYHGEGTLFQYVAEAHRLEEPVARHVFRQLLKGLQTLRKAGICHRALSLENILLRGPDITISDLRSALRIAPPSPSSATSPVTDLPSNLTTSLTTNPKYVAPEMIAQRDDGSYNGFEVDLWAAGVILCSMLFGTEAPFVWASPDDARYREICVKGNLRKVSSKWEAASWRRSSSTSSKTGNNNNELEEEFGSPNKRTKVVSESALDLIQSMLRAKRQDRLTLEQVLEHPWVLDGELEVLSFSSSTLQS